MPKTTDETLPIDSASTGSGQPTANTTLSGCPQQQHRSGRKWRLFGRQQELAVLRQEYDRCKLGVVTHPNVAATVILSTGISTSTNGDASSKSVSCSARLVLVSGPRGVGKRSLVQSLQPVVGADCGLFLSSCCCSSSVASRSSDEKRTVDDQPLQPGGASTGSVFFDVVGNLLHQLTDNQLQMVRDKLLPTYFASPTEFQLLCDILTPMERFSKHIMRDDDDYRTSAKVYHETTRSTSVRTISTSWSATTTALKSNSFILARFVSVISTLLPLVVSLDHVEHAASDDLSALIDLQGCYIPSKGLLVLLLYNNDVDQSAPMQTFLSLQDQTSVEDSNDERRRDRRFTQERCVVLCNLSWDDTYEWIKEWSAGSSEYQVLNERLQALTDFVQKQTMGHPQHIHFLLAWLKHDGVANESRYNADDEAWMTLVKHRLPANVSVLFQQVCLAQTSLVQGVVETAAAILKCSSPPPSSSQFAPTVTCHILEMVLQQPCRDALAVTVECGLLNCYNGRYYRFNGAMLLQAAYNMIPDANRRAQVHLRIGRRLWKHSSLKDGLDDVDMLFMVAQQLQQGIELVSDATERSMIVGIHWEAGKKAMTTGAFATAASYFEFAISLLKDTIWGAETYDITLALCNGAAEAYYSSGDLARMDGMLDAVFDHANSLDDKLQAYTTSVFANGSRGRFREAVATAFDVLGQLGEPLSLNPSTVHVWLAHCKLRRLLHGKGARFYTNLPIATNNNKIAAMTLLNFAVMYAYPFKRPCSDLATFSLIQLATRHGITNAAAFAISAYGVMMVNRHGRFEVGYRYGQIAVELLGRLESRAWLSRVYFMVYGAINPWIRPFRESYEPLCYAQRLALKTGDIEGSATCGWFQLMTAFRMGKQLRDVEHEASAFRTLMQSYGQTGGSTFLLCLCHLANELIGGKSRHSNEYEGVLGSGNKQLLAFHFQARTTICTHMGDYEAAISAAKQAREAKDDVDYTFDFYEGLACFSLARDTTGSFSRQALVSKGRHALKRVQRFATVCPSNFRNKRDFLSAELECLRGRLRRAFALFECSIAMAKSEGFIQEEGLAYERLARYHCFLGHPITAIPYYVCAREAYARWGADAVVRHIEELITRHTAATPQ